MSEARISEILARDFREIPLPSEDEWFPSTTHRPRRLSWRVIALAAAAIAALILGVQVARLSTEPQSQVADPPARPGVLSKVTIRGTVTDASTGQPLGGIRVLVLRDAPPGALAVGHPESNYAGKWAFTEHATTAADGTYMVAVNPGRYRVLFSSAPSFSSPSHYVAQPGGIAGPYEPSWWPNATNDDAATVIVLEADRGEVNAALRPGHVISGQTRSTHGLGRAGMVYAYLAGSQACCAVAHATGVDDDGTFSLAVADGTYRLLFVSGMPFPFETWLANSPDFAHARDLIVSGDDLTGIVIPFED